MKIDAMRYKIKLLFKSNAVKYSVQFCVLILIQFIIYWLLSF